MEFSSTEEYPGVSHALLLEEVRGQLQQALEKSISVQTTGRAVRTMIRKIVRPKKVRDEEKGNVQVSSCVKSFICETRNRAPASTEFATIDSSGGEIERLKLGPTSHRLRRRGHVGAGEQPGWTSKLHHEDVAMAVQGTVEREAAQQVAQELVQSWPPLEKAPKVEPRDAAPHTPPPLTCPLLLSPIQPPGPRLLNHLAPPHIFQHPPKQCPSSPPPSLINELSHKSPLPVTISSLWHLHRDAGEGSRPQRRQIASMKVADGRRRTEHVRLSAIRLM
jgi:hypothetical protein